MASMSPGAKSLFRAMSVLAIPVFINFASVKIYIININIVGINDLHNYKWDCDAFASPLIPNTSC
jgi:hypothetical protein